MRPVCFHQPCKIDPVNRAGSLDIGEQKGSLFGAAELAIIAVELRFFYCEVGLEASIIKADPKKRSPFTLLPRLTNVTRNLTSCY